ncbi:MAG: hypothetical protein M1829_001206 [Trizodia sp. TS-e1964]|nr:MAG: hypothetical protein M1829_001206 [Trizodia sp. TS-e1964]
MHFYTLLASALLAAGSASALPSLKARDAGSELQARWDAATATYAAKRNAQISICQSNDFREGSPCELAITAENEAQAKLKALRPEYCDSPAISAAAKESVLVQWLAEVADDLIIAKEEVYSDEAHWNSRLTDAIKGGADPEPLPQLKKHYLQVSAQDEADQNAKMVAYNAVLAQLQKYSPADFAGPLNPVTFFPTADQIQEYRTKNHELAGPAGSRLKGRDAASEIQARYDAAWQEFLKQSNNMKNACEFNFGPGTPCDTATKARDNAHTQVKAIPNVFADSPAVSAEAKRGVLLKLRSDAGGDLVAEGERVLGDE